MKWELGPMFYAIKVHIWHLLYHFIPFIALRQIYCLFVYNFNFFVHKKIYFAIFFCVYLHISTYSAYYLHISAFLTPYFGSFYCIQIRSLLVIYVPLNRIAYRVYKWYVTETFRLDNFRTKVLNQKLYTLIKGLL